MEAKMKIKLEPGDLLKRKQGHDVILIVEDVIEDFVKLRVLDVPEGNRTYKPDEVIGYTIGTLGHFFQYGILEKIS